MSDSPVIAALHDRPPNAKLTLVVEGGGMRGAVTGGMVLALHELGLGTAFDAAYGSSAGALNAFWLVSGRVEEGMPTWTDPALVHTLISRRRALIGKPIVDIHGLVEERYERLSPGLFEAALAAPTELHPIATDVGTGQAVDLHASISDARTLRLALRASAGLPLLAGPPVETAGGRFVDAGLSAAIPFRAAIADEATHILILRSRREGDTTEAPSARSGKVMSRLLRRIDATVAEAFASRTERELAEEELLARHAAEPDLRPFILSIRPGRDTPVPSRLDRDLERVRGGLDAGRAAVHQALGSRTP